MKSLIFFLSVLLLACGGNTETTDTAEAAVVKTKSAGAPYLTMKINGKQVACHDVFGAYNPKGYSPGTTILAGYVNEDNSQSFNVVLAGVNGTGTITVTNKSDMASNAIQLNDPTATDPFSVRLLATNNKEGESFTIRFTKLGELDVEGSFEGAVTSDNGQNVIRISEGKFDTE